MTGIYTYSFWKLCYPSTFWWQTDWARSLGYCRSRRIRSFTSTLLSRKQRYSCRLLSRFSDKSCECPRQGLSICSVILSTLLIPPSSFSGIPKSPTFANLSRSYSWQPRLTYGRMNTLVACSRHKGSRLWQPNKGKLLPKRWVQNILNAPPKLG